MHYFCLKLPSMFGPVVQICIYHTKQWPTVNLSRLSDTDSMSWNFVGFPSSSFFIESFHVIFDWSYNDLANNMYVRKLHQQRFMFKTHTHTYLQLTNNHICISTHTHTHTYIYIYIYMVGYISHKAGRQSGYRYAFFLESDLTTAIIEWFFFFGPF